MARRIPGDRARSYRQRIDDEARYITRELKRLGVHKKRHKEQVLKYGEEHATLCEGMGITPKNWVQVGYECWETKQPHARREGMY